MFFTEYIAAAVKMLWTLGFAIVSSLIFCPAWNCVASNYLVAWIPAVFICIPYWHIVAIILTCTFIGEQINKLVPKIVSINTSTNNPNP